MPIYTSIRYERLDTPRISYPEDRQEINAQSYARAQRRFLRTDDPRWRKIRARKLAIDPLCEHCRLHGITRAATEVDHKDCDSGNNNFNNLSSLCKSCHSRKTALYDGGFGNKKR